MEAFVYVWTDTGTNKIYVGVHKGDSNDGYVCSSKYMKAEYKKRLFELNGSWSPLCKEVIIDNVSYKSIADAERKTGISKYIIRKMLKDADYGS